MIVGTFTQQEDGALFGNLPTMGLTGVSLEPVEKKGKGADYQANVEGAELGAAWKKTAKESGKEYLNFMVVRPGFDTVWLAIFATKEAGRFVAAYNETKPKADGEDA